MERKNKKTRSVGNGEGSLYYSEASHCWKYQYWDNDKRQTIQQKKKESVRDFKARVTKLKNEINTGTYIAQKDETVITILEKHIKSKHDDGITSARTYIRDLETLAAIKKTCFNFCNLPIQKVTINHVESAKKEIRKYSKNSIDKIWRFLKKAFKIACSPSRKILIFNIMEDEELKKPVSLLEKKKITALSRSEHNKLMNILNNEEINHKYRNIVKMQLISGMRIGEVLARSINDFDIRHKQLNIHNTLTQDENYKTILGEHTKTYNKETQIDEGQRYLPLDNKLFTELQTIYKEQQNKKVANIYNLLFWDYRKNTFITPGEINSWLERINKKYQICSEKLTTHRLRHSAITRWSESGIPLSAIQYLAGHVEGSSITDDIYIDTSFEYVKDELSKIV